jgi:nicotinamidase-related amidase
MKINSFLIGLILISGITAYSQDSKETQAKIKPALLVIDIQNAYLDGMQGKEQAMMNINYYIQYFRDNGFPIIRVYHYNKEFGPQQGTEPFEYPSSVLVKPDDPKVIKTYGDAFNKTDLDSVLKAKGVNTVFLCGLSAVACVLSTWIGAQNHDYKAFMIKDAIMSHNQEFTDNVESMFDAVGPDIIMLVLENSKN